MHWGIYRQARRFERTMAPPQKQIQEDVPFVEQMNGLTTRPRRRVGWSVAETAAYHPKAPSASTAHHDVR